eukprot:134017-Rhodomonas_salina.4
MVHGICRAYLNITKDPTFGSLFHYRDLIHVCRSINRNTPPGTQPRITVQSLLCALEENLNGLPRDIFRQLVAIVFKCVDEEMQRLGQAFPEPEETDFRTELEVLRDALLQEDSPDRDQKTDVELRRRFLLVIDPSDDHSGVRLMDSRGLLPPKAATDGEVGTHVLVMSQFDEDGSDIQCAALISKFTFWMERGDTVLLINTGRIHGALYDVLNQHYRRMTASDGNGEKVYANVTVGSQTYACSVHPRFRCIVHLPEREVHKTPAPFLSRFEKFLLSSETLMDLSLLSRRDRELLAAAEERV